MIRRYTASSTARTIAILQRGKYLAMIFNWTHMFRVKNCVPVFKKFQGLKIKGNIRMANNIKSFQKEDPEIVSSLKTYKTKWHRMVKRNKNRQV